jgi:predicted transcriptional regulator
LTASTSLLVRDVMRIGVPTCKLEDTLAHVAALMIDGGYTAVVVLDEEADTRGWINERILASAYEKAAATAEDASQSAAQDVMDEDVPECPSDIPLTAAAQLMADAGVDHLFFLHHAGGRAWPASVLSQRDLVRVLAGPEYIKNQGAAAPRPTPMDLFRQRYGLASKR